jgi:hypothetical protein
MKVIFNFYEFLLNDSRVFKANRSAGKCMKRKEERGGVLI